MRQKIILYSLLLILAVPVGLIALMASETGSRWLLRAIFASQPVKMSADNIEGRLLDQLSLTGLRYESDTEIVAVKQLHLRWQPAKLFVKTLKIIDFNAEGLAVQILKGEDKPKSEGGFDENFRLPVKLDIGNLVITHISFKNGETTQYFERFQLAATTEGDQFRLLQFEVDSTLIKADAKGYITLDKDLPLNLEMNWRVNADENGLWQGNTVINGKLNHLIIDNRLEKPFSLALTGTVENVLKTPRLNITAGWRNVNWPFTKKPAQIQSPQGRITLTGPLDDYKLQADGKVSQQYLPQADFYIDSNGSMEGIKLNKLALKSGGGLFEVMGRASWKDIPAFELTASGKNFNPGIFIPELPGNLTFTGHINGKLYPKTPQISAGIDEMKGQLRKQPFNAKGKFNLNGERLSVDGLQLVFGKNKLSIEGNLNKRQGDLKVSIDMPRMDALWPGLAGNLSGHGQLQGGWGNPAISSSLQGKGIRFQQHSADNLALTAAYSPDETIISKLNVSAAGIRSDGIRISQLSVKGSGSLKRHEFKADIQSPQADLTATFTGSLADKQWRGDVSRLDIKEPDGRIWTLNKTAAIRISKKTDGIDAAFDETCLVQQPAALCAKGTFRAGGDLNFLLTAKAIPARLMNPFLPEQVSVNTLINGNADIQSKNNVLTGQYRFNTAPVRILLKTKDTDKELRLGTSDISGDFKGGLFTSDLKLNLMANDYIRSTLHADTGKGQILSGNITAAVADFSMVPVFVPQLANVKGRLSANITVRGALAKPVVKGTVDLVDGSADTDQMGLRQLDLHAVAPGDGNPIRLNGSAVPVILRKADAEEQVQIKTIVNVTAEIQQSAKPAGSFRLTLPPGAILSLKGKDNQIKLGAANINGVIQDDLLSADLDMALAGQDYLRGKLALSTGNTQSLSGQANASIRHLEWLEVLAPELSKVKGRLTADLTMAGTTQKPVVNGALKLNNAEAEISQLGIKISDINLQAEAPSLNSDNILLSGSAKSGQGMIKLEGSVGMQPDQQWPVRLTLQGSDFEAAKLPEAEIAVSPDLQFQASGGRKKISGVLAVPKAVLKLQDIPENAVNVSEDEIILGEEKPEKDIPKEPDIQADIEIKLGRQVSFTGQGLQTGLGGNLKIFKKGGKMAMQGNVDMHKASYKRFGQDLTVRKGRFLFNGPVDNPWLDVEAIRLSKSKKVTAILSLSGTLKNPQTRIYSEPSLPESEALAYLVTGGPLSQVSKAESNALASAALSYGAGKATWLADKLGIDEFNVEEGGALKDTLLTMGQYLTPDFYVGTKVGMFNKQAALVLKHKITDRINVETQTGTSQRIKLNYEFDGD